VASNHQTSDVSVERSSALASRLLVRAESRLVLADGRQLSVRAIDARDGASLARLFDRLSPESRYRRFLSPKPRLSARELVHLTAIDHVDHDALAAVDPDDGSIVGVGRYAREASRPWAAHIAVTVADELQGHGIGTALAQLAVERARANGYTLLVATTLWENRPARALLRRLGFCASGSDGAVLELELDLAPTGHPR
jgi:RimJ/RimL family protein N-acetyltransferase